MLYLATPLNTPFCYRAFLSAAPRSDSIDSLDDNPFPILSRPGILPNKPKDINDVLRSEGIDVIPSKAGASGIAGAGAGAGAGHAHHVGNGAAGFGGDVYGNHSHNQANSAHNHAHNNTHGKAHEPKNHPTGYRHHQQDVTHTPPNTAANAAATVSTLSGTSNQPSAPEAALFSEAPTRENSDHFDPTVNTIHSVNHLHGRVGSPKSGKHNPAAGFVNADHHRPRSFGGIGSFSDTSSKYGGSMKFEDHAAEQTAGIVQAALAAAARVQGDDSVKLPFEARENDRERTAPAPPLKSQVRELSKRFGGLMRQTSAVMYRSIRGSRQFNTRHSMNYEGDSALGDTDDQSMFFEEQDDIPLAEIDEMDCLKNASVKILLSFFEFLEDGKQFSVYLYAGWRWAAF